MKILYLTDQTYLHGGIEKVLSQKANYLAEVMGDNVTILTHSQQSNPSCYSFSSKIKFLDLGVNYVSGKSYFDLDNLKKICKHKWTLNQIILKIKPDIIVSSSFGPDFYFLPFVQSSIPKIKEFHSSRFFEEQNTSSKKALLLQKLGKFAESKYDSIVVLNKSEICFYNNQNIKVISNPAEISGEKVNVANKQILAAGRIAPVKNFGDLIEAFSMVSTEFPDWQLHFFGEDYNGTQEQLEEKIKNFGLEDKVTFKGSTLNLKKQMQNYSIYGMTSETECFPMVLLESLSVGLPVITYDSPTGPKHIVTGKEDGFIIPYKNLSIFAEQLKKMMSDEDLRENMGKKGITNMQRFSIDKVMNQWKDLFNAVLSKQSL